MNNPIPTCLLAALLLAAALPTRAQSSIFGTAGAGSEETNDELCGYEMPLFLQEGKHAPARTLVPVPMPSVEQEHLALDYCVGVLQTQVELLSQRLALLEATLSAPTTTAAKQ